MPKGWRSETYHHVLRFLWKAQNQVNHGEDVPLFQIGHGLIEDGAGIAAVHLFSDGIVDGLKPQLHPQEGPAVVFRKQIQNLGGEAVGTGGNRQSHHARPGQGVVEQAAQHLRAGVGVGVALKVGDVLSLRPLAGQETDLIRNGAGVMAGAVFGTEQTASHAFGAVSIGTGEAAVQRQLHNAAAEPAFQPGGDGIEMGASEFIFHEGILSMSYCFQVYFFMI